MISSEEIKLFRVPLSFGRDENKQEEKEGLMTPFGLHKSHEIRTNAYVNIFFQSEKV